MRTSALKWAVPVAMAGVVVMWTIGFIGVQSSDAFAYARRALRASPVIRDRLGPVKSVGLSPWGFRVSYYGADADAELECKVKGQRRDATVFLRLHRDTGVWAVRRASLDGELIELDTATVAASDSSGTPPSDSNP